MPIKLNNKYIRQLFKKTKGSTDKIEVKELKILDKLAHRRVLLQFYLNKPTGLAEVPIEQYEETWGLPLLRKPNPPSTKPYGYETAEFLGYVLGPNGTEIVDFDNYVVPQTPQKFYGLWDTEITNVFKIHDNIDYLTNRDLAIQSVFNLSIADSLKYLSKTNVIDSDGFKLSIIDNIHFIESNALESQYYYNLDIIDYLKSDTYINTFTPTNYYLNIIDDIKQDIDLDLDSQYYYNLVIDDVMTYLTNVDTLIPDNYYLSIIDDIKQDTDIQLFKQDIFNLNIVDNIIQSTSVVIPPIVRYYLNIVDDIKYTINKDLDSQYYYNLNIVDNTKYYTNVETLIPYNYYLNIVDNLNSLSTINLIKQDIFNLNIVDDTRYNVDKNLSIQDIYNLSILDNLLTTTSSDMFSLGFKLVINDNIKQSITKSLERVRAYSVSILDTIEADTSTDMYSIVSKTTAPSFVSSTCVLNSTNSGFIIRVVIKNNHNTNVDITATINGATSVRTNIAPQQTATFERTYSLGSNPSGVNVFTYKAKASNAEMSDTGSTSRALSCPVPLPQTLAPGIGAISCAVINGLNTIVASVTNYENTPVTIYAGGLSRGTVPANSTATIYLASGFNPPYSYGYNFTAQASGKAMSSGVFRSGTVNFCIAM